VARIAIIGTGRMASGLAAGWSKAGHSVVLGSRQPEGKTSSGAVVTGQVAALDGAEVVVLAMPYAAVEPFARAQAATLRVKVVIDISNPFDRLPDNRTSGAEVTAAAIGHGAKVIAAFKGNFAATLGQPIDSSGVVRDVHFAGDDEGAKALGAQLIRDLGFRPIDCGAMKNARVLDGMVPLMIELDRRHGTGAASVSWKLLP